MSNDVNASAAVKGTIRADGNCTGTVRMESRYPTDPDDLWSALTEPSRLGRWIAEVEGDLVVGGTFKVVFTSGWEGPGRVDVCEPPVRLVVTLDPGTADETTIEAVLGAESGGTRLVVQERGIPLAEIAAHGAGWQTHLEDLGSHVAGDEASDWRPRWRELTSTYEDMSRALD